MFSGVETVIKSGRIIHANQVATFGSHFQVNYVSNGLENEVSTEVNGIRAVAQPG